MENTFANRLVNARKIRCMSQRNLAEALEISASAIQKYENGKMMPSSNILIQMCKILNVNLDYFFRPFNTSLDLSKFEFRKKSSLGEKQKESIKLIVASKVEKYLEIESFVNDSVTFSLDYSDIIASNEKDAIEIAQRIRRDWNIGFDAIVSAIELLESCGVKIIEVDENDKFSGACNMVDSIPIIAVNKNMQSERKRLTIFHELGHLVMKFADGADKEKLCNVFANEVLIPSEKFISIIGPIRHDISLVELKAIQQEYGISIDALMAKANNLNIISNQRYQVYYKKKNSNTALRESIEKSRYENERTSRFERLVYRALASEIISFSKAAALLEISVNDVRKNLNLM